MVEVNEKDENLNFPLEATAFLAAVSAFAVFLLVIFMYVNKKWHFFNINVGNPGGSSSSRGAKAKAKMDMDGIGNKNQPSSLYPSVKSLQMNNVNLKSQSESYSIPSADNSSDSEEDVLRRLRSMNTSNNNNNGNVSIAQQTTSTPYVVHHNPNQVQHHPHLNQTAQSSSVSVPMHGFNSSFDSREGSPSRNYHHQQQQQRVLHHQPLSVQLSGGSPGRSSLEGRRRLQLMHQQRSLDLDYMREGMANSSPPPARSHQMLQSHYNNPILPPQQAHGHNPMNRPSSTHSHYSAPPTMMMGGGGVPGSGSHMMGRRPLRVSTIRDIDDGASVGSSNGSRRRSHSHHQKGLMRSGTAGPRSLAHETDLMSLAEKGKVCRESSASSTSSNVSAEDDLLRNHPNHHGMMGVRHHPHHLRRQQSDIGHQSNHAGHNQRSMSMTSNGSLPRHHHGILTRQSSQSSSSSACPPPSRHHPLTISSSNSAPVANSSGTGENRTLTMVHSNPNFRRLMMPPRTKSVDSESPPPSEQGLSTYGDSVADQDDHIFEEMSMEEGELGMIMERSRRIPTSPAQCGDFEVAFDYDAPARKLTVHVIQARGVPTKEMGGANHTQIRVVLLQSRKQRQKTKVRSGENPQFMESFVFNKINPEDVSSLGIRFRLYGCERMRREKLLGECVLSFGAIHLELETTLWLNFEPRYQLSWDARSECDSLARSDSASSTQSVQTGIPELLIGLAYNGTTGRLTAEIIKGSHFRNLAGGRAPDSYIKLVLVGCNGQEMGRAKSSLRRAQSNPLFKETFMFQVALFQVTDVTLLVSVYGRKGVTRRELLGWFALGYSSSGDEEATHWEDMCDAQGDQMCRWHVLLQS